MLKMAKVCVVLTVTALLGLAPVAVAAEANDDGVSEGRRPAKRVLNRELGGNRADGGTVSHEPIDGGTGPSAIELGVEKRDPQPRLDENGSHGNGGDDNGKRRRGKRKGWHHHDDHSDDEDEDPDGDEDPDETPIGF